MACRLFGAKPLPNRYGIIVNWNFKNNLQFNFNQNTKLFIHKNASEYVVCEMAAILSRGDKLSQGLVRNTVETVQHRNLVARMWVTPPCRRITTINNRDDNDNDDDDDSDDNFTPHVDDDDDST